MWLVNREGNCVRRAATPAKAKRLCQVGFVLLNQPKAVRTKENKKK